ncbi:MAG TPA: ABC transporter permease [Gemmatimonadales bacterium]|jgi:putative ABC transport system permease protein|nr:ABC transporter permease [Gemmatimonadales bacterium]
MKNTRGGSIARVFEGMGMALDSVRANKVRASLTILGVAIGVMVVITMASAITGVNRAVAKQLETLGPKTFFVFRFFQGGLNISDGSDEMSPWRRNPWLTTEEAQLIRGLPSIKDVGYREGSGGPVSYGDQKLSSVSITGFTTNWPNVSGGTITQGRNWTDIEFAAGSNVAVINDKMADTFFPGLDPIGKRIKIYGEPFTVVGVYAEAASLFGGASSPIVNIPHTTFTKVADWFKGWLDFVVLPNDSATVAQAQDEVIAALRVKRGLKPSQENNFSVVTQDKLMDTFNSVTSGFFLVMLALSSVGLLVGGVGVVAIMMISVTERTREIGVRKALGATRREILFQFLVEASSLTLLGGGIGLAVGALLAWAIAKFTPIPAAVPLWSVVAALVMSAVTGVFFGMYPATKASRLDPVEALRYE